MPEIAIPGTMSVEELIDFPDAIGSYSYYKVDKHTGSIDAVCKSMATHLGVTPSAIVFPAARDLLIPTKQHASVRKSGPEIIQGDGYRATLLRTGPRKLRTDDIQSNRYTVKLDSLSQEKLDTLQNIVDQLETNGLPNYYGNFKFRTKTNAGYIGKAIVKHRAKRAVKLYLAEPQLKDTEEIRTFKTLVKQHWGQWGYLLHQAPRPSNLRSVITYLKDNTDDYEGAINLVRDQYLRNYLVVYQAYLWNQILALYITENSKTFTYIEIADQPYPLLTPYQHKKLLTNMEIELPRLTANYSQELESVVKSILQRESLTLKDFNIRLLRRVCFAKDTRRTLFTPDAISVEAPKQGTKQDGMLSAVLKFNLAPKQYGSLIINALSAYLETSDSTA